MEVLKLGTNVDNFWFNYWMLKNTSSISLPMDSIMLECRCGQSMPVMPHGEIFLDSNLKSVEEIIESKIHQVENSHYNDGACQFQGQTMEIIPPENIVLLVKTDANQTAEPIKLGQYMFDPKLVVSDDHNIAMILYQNNSSPGNVYEKFIKNNFETFLNTPDQGSVEDDNIIEDDDQALANKHKLPRMLGGGRKVRQDFKYICQWCSNETLQKRTRGRFREIKNYRDHFRKFHENVPFSEFLNNVERDEPKFYCKLCKQKLSLSNQLRHQVICRPQEYEQQTSSSEDDGLPDIPSPSDDNEIDPEIDPTQATSSNQT